VARIPAPAISATLVFKNLSALRNDICRPRRE
jgi:hypothetical protein